MVREKVKIARCGPNHPIDKRAQILGFAPNFVHSVDAAHMMQVALQCKRERIQIACAHDSFWTHAADMERLMKIVRTKFQRTHEQPLLDVLYREQIEVSQFAAIKLKRLPPPPIGEYDVHLVLRALFPFF